MFRYSDKEMKTIAVKRMLVTKSTLKMILHTEKAMKTTIQKNLLTKSPKSAEFRCSEAIFFRFTVILHMILKLVILWNFILKLYLRSWSLLNCTHCILVSVSPNFLYYNCLISCSDLFHYFRDAKFQKSKRKN